VSIYCTSVSFDADDHADSCARWVECSCPDPHQHGRAAIGIDKHWPYDHNQRCTCQAGPIAYHGSHVLPANNHPRSGHLDLAHIPGFIQREGRPPLSDTEYEPYHPWLRASVNGQTVILDRAQVVELHTYLTGWLTYTDGETP
jgi:hypothetical protein